MSRDRASVSFFTPISQLFSTIGRSFYPVSRQAVGPFRMSPSYAGKTVTPESALQIAAAFACVRLLSQTIATLPLSLYRIDSKGKRTIATDHRVNQLIHSRPNAYMTAYGFWQMMAASLLLWGNAYAVKRKIRGELVAIEPLRPEYMVVYRTPDGEIRYRYENTYDGIEPVDYAASDIFHVKYFSVDGLIGISPVALGAQSIGRTIATDEASGKIFGSGLNASGFIKYQQTLKDDQREGIRARISEFTAGGRNAGGIMILENGMEFAGITMKPSDAQLLESKLFNVEEVARWFGVPPVRIGQMDKASSWASSLESLNRIFFSDGVNPILVNLEQEIIRQLIPVAQSTSYEAIFDADAMLRGDSVARAALYSAYAQNGVADRNEIRGWENLPPREGADVLTVQSNLIPLDKIGQVSAANTPQNDPSRPEKG